MSLVVDGDEEAPGAAVHQPVLLAGQAYGGRVHDGHHVSHVLAHEAVEQVLVAVLEKVLFDIRRCPAYCDQLSCLLSGCY